MIDEININRANIEQIEMITTNLFIGYNRDILIKGIRITNPKNTILQMICFYKKQTFLHNTNNLNKRIRICYQKSLMINLKKGKQLFY